MFIQMRVAPFEWNQPSVPWTFYKRFIEFEAWHVNWGSVLISNLALSKSLNLLPI